MGYEFQQVSACDMCGSTEFRTLGLRLDSSQGLNPRRAGRIGIPIKQCQCGLIFADPTPIPNSISDHYGIPPEDYWVPSHFVVPPDYFADEIATAKRLLNFTSGMTALDIGVGVGRITTALTRAGFDTWGIEPSAPFRDKAISVLGIDEDRIRHSAMEETLFPEASFDLITFGAVLEHLHSPNKALERALRWLKPNGIIHAEVPSSRWLISTLVNSYYRMRGTDFVTNLSPMHAPFHLYEFSLEAFERNGRRLGYAVADHKFMVCEVYHVPKLLHPVMRWLMNHSDRGMQLTVYLKARSDHDCEALQELN